MKLKDLAIFFLIFMRSPCNHNLIVLITNQVMQFPSVSLVYLAHFKYASSVVCCCGYLSYNQIIKIKKRHHQLYFIFNNPYIIYILLLPSTGSWKNVGISHTKAIYIFVTTYSKRTISPSNLVLSTSNMVVVISKLPKL